MLIDLDELPTIFSKHPLWSVEKANVATFRRSDYLGDPKTNLKQAVRQRIREAGKPVPEGSIRLLTHIRYFGYAFNPVSFYYCYNKHEVLECIVAEVTNTPWDERFAYVLSVEDAKTQANLHTFKFQKDFHVSPFLDMDYEYEWCFGEPKERLRVHMKNHRGPEVDFNATLFMKREPITRANLSRVLVDFPWMTASVVLKIYWQAFGLWLRKATFFNHPDKRTLPENPHARKSS